MMHSILNSLNFLDYVFLVIVILSLFAGLKRSFIRELIVAGIWLIAIICAVFLTKTIAAYFAPYIHDPKYALLTAFLSLLIVILILGAIVNLIFKAILASMEKTFSGRLLGGLLGIITGLMVSVIIVFILNIFWANEHWLQDSQLYSCNKSLVSDMQNEAFGGPLYPTVAKNKK